MKTTYMLDVVKAIKSGAVGGIPPGLDDKEPCIFDSRFSDDEAKIILTQEGVNYGHVLYVPMDCLIKTGDK